MTDFGFRANAEEKMRETWNEFRFDLATGAFSYKDCDTAKNKAVFLKQFDDLFSNCHHLFEKSLETVSLSSTTLMRAGKLKDEDPFPTYSRFVPSRKYITSHNRFSPPGTEWLYIAMGDSDNAEKCALKECRASKGDRFGLCQFKINEEYSKRELVDLTIACDSSYDELNNHLEGMEHEIRKREVKRIINGIVQCGCFPKPNIDDYMNQFRIWFAYTYVRMLSEQIFVPVDTVDKERCYAPFQCVAQYFLNFGYEGIVYSSTVLPSGKNVVLFDRDAAVPVGKIKIITI